MARRNSAKLIEHWLVTKIAALLNVGPAEIDPQKTFETYGLGSTEAVSLSGELEEWLGRELSPTLAYQYPTIESLTAFLSQPQRDAVSTRNQTRLQPDSSIVSIVGMSCRFPGGANSPEQFWRLLADGAHAAKKVPPERWNIAAYYDADLNAPGRTYTDVGAFVDDLAGFDAAFFDISPREALRIDPHQRLLLEVAWEALEHAGLASDRLRGSRTGVFIGMMDIQQYAQLQLSVEGRSCIDDPYFAMGSSASVAAGRISYTLDLRGPSVCVDTACSSSLVCVHLACESLRRRECDLALIGGASAIMHPHSLVQGCKMRMLARDGRCKTFDAAADGFLMGEGCGVVVLERLDDALANGHNLHALIRGSAINQDGRSNGLTAPNKLAQVGVIRQALANAGVTADEVSYVEAHGSGTRLGDTIEMEALQEVFGDDRPDDHSLIVGAVKTNIGHLLGAAGVAGLIKVALALRHQQIPRNLHLRELNPGISLDKCPMVLPAELMSWSAGGRSRVAGVSSFGWSGTNAHVVVQEAPAPRVSARAEPEPWQVILLSAESAHALRSSTENLLAWLQAHPDAALADVAYTTQVGRSALSERRALVCRDTADAIRALERTLGEDAVPSTRKRGPPHPTLFMFPGVGDHYPSMGWELYRDEDVFRSAVDRCAALLSEQLGFDLRDALYPAGAELENGLAPSREAWVSGHPDIDLRAMLRPVPEPTALFRADRAQPAVFAIDYALAQLWQHWGVHPDAMIGYSLGEYVAACLAGVFTLQDALLLVAERARLIQKLPPGAMTAVAEPERQARARLGGQLSLAAVNSPTTCVLAGPVDAIADLERQLGRDGVTYRRLRTTHAFHSSMLEPLRQQFAGVVRSIARHEPRLPFISNVTGTWITAEQAVDPTYWSTHLCHPVRFAPGIEELYGHGAKILLEVGPGQSLTSFARQTLGATEHHQDHQEVVLASMRSVYERRSDRESLLTAAARLWSNGGRIDWSALHHGRRRHVVPLPTYPFTHDRYWPAAEERLVRDPSPAERSGKRPDLADWCYVPSWRQSHELPPRERNAANQPNGLWLIFADECGVCGQLAQRLEDAGQTVVTVVPALRFQRLGQGAHAGAYTIDHRAASDYEALLSHVMATHGAPTRILHGWAVAQPQRSPERLELLDGLLAKGFYSLLFLAQALGRGRLAPDAELTVLTSNGQEVLGGDALSPEKAMAPALCRAISQEYRQLRCRCVDVSALDQDGLASSQLVEQLMRELSLRTPDDVVAYRGTHRWARTWEPVRIEPADPSRVWRDRGVYVITGGTGGLGLALARYLACTVRARLALVSRSPLPARERWEELRAHGDPSDPVIRKIRAIIELEQAGAQVLVIAADVADHAQLESALADVRHRFGTVHGVIHAAGVPGAGLIQLKTQEQAEQILRPKVRGTALLDRALCGEQLDFIVLYSSSTAVLGGLGESDYCAANAFMGTYAQCARSQGGSPIIAIDWAPWQWDSWQSAMFVEFPEIQQRMRELRDQYGITFDEGAQLLTRILAAPFPQVLVLPQDIETSARQWERLSCPDFLSTPALPKRGYARPNLRTPYVAPRSDVEKKIAELWQEQLGMERVGVNDPFFELGGNSLIGLVIVSRLEKQFSIALSAASLFEHPTVGLLAELVSAPGHSAPALAGDRTRGERRRRTAQTRIRRKAPER